MNQAGQLEESVRVFEQFLAERAFKEGYDAYKPGGDRNPPARLLTFAGKWVEGWIAAEFDAIKNKAGESSMALLSAPHQSSAATLAIRKAEAVETEFCVAA